ncbi:MAG: PAS domain-containing sensor histidine kinase [Nocardioides sp.]|uniref:sensor histidine kinase n=1 Tax=Nocardioides sp. TaxID=35761 RepID=UPI00238C713D|nr:PAS domain-containing sensor histidine kinase [Nocardioides sp.]MDE0777056.1 PAS domain-containing sensor histidine kinase [Nocardioides sp.]
MGASTRLSDPADVTALVDSIQARTVASLPRAELVRRLSLVSLGAGLAMMLVGGVTALGWFTGTYDLTRVSSGLASMKLTTATCVVAVGLAILVKRSRRPGARVVALSLAGGVAALCVVALAQYALGTTYDIDNWFGLDPGRVGGDPPGRMSVATACGLLLLCVALYLGHEYRYWASQMCATACGVLAGVTLVGYLYGADSLYDIGAFRSISLTTSLSLLLGAIGVVLRHADEGYASLISGNTAGGIIVRRILPVSFLVPIVAGGLVVHLQPDDVADETSGLIAVAASLVGFVGAGLVWLQASRLRSIDLRRAGAENAFAIARDALRAQQEAEQRTRAIITASAAGYLSFDLEGRVIDYNDAALATFARTPEQVLGVRVDKLVARSSPVDGDSDRSALRLYLDGEGPLPGNQRYEATATSLDGRSLVLDVVLWSVEDEDEGLGFHVFMTDISGRKQSELELRRANDDLANFSAAMAHDLRTPLTVVKGFASMLRGNLEGRREEEFVARIEGAADRGSRLIDDILAFAQIGREALHREPVDLTTLAEHVSAEHVVASDRRADVRVEPLPRVPGDEALLRTMLSNFVGNAIKYVPDDRDPAVVVDSVLDEATGWPVIRIADNGDPLEDTDRLFDMFERGAADDRTVGSGVGLAVCRRIAELHGGRAWLETSEAGGPRFCVLLSAAPAVRPG